MTNKVPDVIFRTRVRDESIGGDNPFRWQLMTTNDYFANKRVVVFSLPGAFTPTCSTMQVPGYEKNYDLIRSLGIDEVYVISVNDTFVMRQWMMNQGIKNLKFIPDGNGDFTESMGMLVDKSNLGFGRRSWRYSMVVDNLKIETLFEEPGLQDLCIDDPYSVSSPEFMIKYLQSVR
jgi:thioredoxin-dependent peroxiredoxin